MPLQLNEIQDLIKFVAKSGVCEVSLELKDFKITIKTSAKPKKGTGGTEENATANPVASTALPPATEAVAEKGEAAEKKRAGKKEEDGHLLTIKSPMIGTFYRSPEPGKPPFVEVGDEFRKGQVICIIEAMKLFNEIEAEAPGKLAKVLAADATPVEYDQPLFLVEPL